MERPRVRIDTALSNTAMLLHLFLSEVFQAWKGSETSWIQFLAERDVSRTADGQTRQTTRPSEYHHGDLSHQLRMMAFLVNLRSGPLFVTEASTIQATMREIRMIRNQIYHHHPAVPEMADRAVANCNRLLGWIEAPAVAEERDEREVERLAKGYATNLKKSWNPPTTWVAPVAPIPASSEPMLDFRLPRPSEATVAWHRGIHEYSDLTYDSEGSPDEVWARSWDVVEDEDDENI